ncbi:MAG TPA: DUF4175 family protein [Methylomirabilota bacterium]|nr:DUF4175 family protein [Methylomirabilota bacterium]
MAPSSASTISGAFTDSSNGPTSVAPSPLLMAQLARLRRHHTAVATLTGLALAAVVGIELLALALFLDWWLELPWLARLVSLGAQVGILGFILVRYVARPIWQQPSDDELALLVERHRPEFRSRLISAVQFARPGAIPPGASTTLAAAVVAEAERLATPLDFRHAISTQRLRQLGVLAILIPLLALGALWSGREVAVPLLQRALLSTVPVPRKTRVIVPEGNRTIGRGDAVRLEAFAEGVLPTGGRVEVRQPGRRPQVFPLERNRENPRHFGRTIENVQDSFRYQIFLHDGVSPVFEVRALPRPTVASLECAQEFPAYTGLKAMRRNLGDLNLLAGSVLKLRVTATKDLQAAALRLVGPNRELPLQVSDANRREVTGQFTVPTNGLTGFSVRMLDTEDMESRDAAVYRVEVLPDKPPVVRLTHPERKEELVTRYATLLLGLTAQDDFGLARLQLHYKISTVDGGAEKIIELDLEDQRPRQISRRFPWNLGEFRPLLAEGSVIEFWLEAHDINDTTGPGVGRSERQLARVVSQAEKTADLLNRASDALSGIGDVALDQERLNRSLGAIIREKAGM